MIGWHNEYGVIVGIIIGRETEALEKKCPNATFPPQIQYYFTWDRSGNTGVGNRRSIVCDVA
jgi:hypothetical protein